MKKTKLLICFLVISISGFGQLSIELEKMLNHRIISNRTLWRVNTFMEVYSDSTNPNSFLEKDYQRLFFKNYESEKILIHLIDSMEFNEFLTFDFTFYWRCSCKTDKEFLEKQEELFPEFESDYNTFSTSQCFMSLSGTNRGGQLAKVPMCSHHTGIVAIPRDLIDRKFYYDDEKIYFVSGGCIYLNSDFGEMYFKSEGITENSVKKYIYMKFWDCFVNTNKYEYKIQTITRVDSRHWKFTIIDKKDLENDSMRYRLNVESGEIIKL